MSNFKKEWIEALEERFGKVNAIEEYQSEGKPSIHVFFFEDLPESGCLTAITCGLSNSNHPEWKYGKPELIISIDTKDRNWGLAMAYFASTFFDEKTFSFGDIFKIDTSISDESEMNAYLLFAPSFVQGDDARFELSDRTINLTGMYPIYDSEIDLYNDIGLENFWKMEGLDIYNPKRPPIQ